MTEAETILKMIETVDHTDRRAMFALNERAYEWLLKVNPKTEYGLFVFSRDALKAIRPKGFEFPMDVLTNGAGFIFGYGCPAFNNGKFLAGYSKPLFTEELAEFHAIIQIKDFERSKDDER